jgi:hypothetical protein
MPYEVLPCLETNWKNIPYAIVAADRKALQSTSPSENA